VPVGVGVGGVALARPGRSVVFVRSFLSIAIPVIKGLLRRAPAA
jgi:hypothetical protein